MRLQPPAAGPGDARTGRPPVPAGCSRLSLLLLLCLASPSLAGLPSAAPAAAVSPPATPAASPAGAAPSSSPPAAPGSTGPQARTADEAFELRFKAVEEKVVDLKEQIYRTKARLLLLQETVLGGELSAGARAVLVHRNEMGASFVLESVAYVLDGAPVFTRVDSNGDLANLKDAEIFSGRIVPGQHQLAVRLVYRGSGFGVFSYLEDYRFKVQSSYTFNAEAGRITTVRVVGYERGGLSTDLQDRPAVRYDLEVSREGRAPPQAVGTQPPEPAAPSAPK